MSAISRGGSRLPEADIEALTREMAALSANERPHYKLKVLRENTLPAKSKLPLQLSIESSVAQGWPELEYLLRAYLEIDDSKQYQRMHVAAVLSLGDYTRAAALAAERELLLEFARTVIVGDYFGAAMHVRREQDAKLRKIMAACLSKLEEHAIELTSHYRPTGREYAVARIRAAAGPASGDTSITRVLADQPPRSYAELS